MSQSAGTATNTATMSKLDEKEIAAVLEIVRECEEAVTHCASVVFDSTDPTEYMSEVRHDFNCADVLATTRRVLARRDGSDDHLVTAQLEACLIACQISNDLCSPHAEEYPKAMTCTTATARGIQMCQDLLHRIKA